MVNLQSPVAVEVEVEAKGPPHPVFHSWSREWIDCSSQDRTVGQRTLQSTGNENKRIFGSSPGYFLPDFPSSAHALYWAVCFRMIWGFDWR